MNIILRFYNRLVFRRNVKKNEVPNVVEGIVKAKKLYKYLSIKVHPDRNPEKRKEAEELMARIVANKHNYAVLKKIQEEARIILNNQSL